MIPQAITIKLINGFTRTERSGRLMKRMSTEGEERQRRERRRLYRNTLIHLTRIFKWLRRMEESQGALLRGRYLRAFMQGVLIRLDLQ
jgi:hypothetical protein